LKRVNAARKYALKRKADGAVRVKIKGSVKDFQKKKTKGKLMAFNKRKQNKAEQNLGKTVFKFL
jgi:hypothetical protein